jgi:hypothetical protein
MIRQSLNQFFNSEHQLPWETGLRAWTTGAPSGVKRRLPHDEFLAVNPEPGIGCAKSNNTGVPLTKDFAGRSKASSRSFFNARGFVFPVLKMASAPTRVTAARASLDALS